MYPDLNYTYEQKILLNFAKYLLRMSKTLQ